MASSGYAPAAVSYTHLAIGNIELICTNNQLAVAGNALNLNSVSELDGAALSDIEGAELYSARHNNGGILINGNILCIQDGRQGALEVNKVDVALISAIQFRDLYIAARQAVS